MGTAICQRSDGLILSFSGLDGVLPADPVLQVAVFACAADPRTERWDGATALRPATAQEIADYDALRLDTEAKVRADDKLMKAVLIYLVQRLNELRTQPSTSFPALTAQAVRDGIVAIYKGLP